MQPTSQAAMSGGSGGQGRRRGKGYLLPWQGAPRPKGGERPGGVRSVSGG